MRKFKWINYLPLILFAAFIWGYSLADLFYPSREYSEMENRYLQQAPSFSARALFNNTYTIRFEEFTNDQFALRDSWITLKSLCETALFKIENNGVVYGGDGYMFERRVSVDNAQLQKNMDSVMALAAEFPDENFTLMLVPTSDMVLTDNVPKGLNNFDQLTAIDDIYERAIGAEIKIVDVYSVLSAQSGHSGAEYVYYRTDHHWTTYGAYLAYMEFARVISTPARSYFWAPSVESVGGNVHGFYGTYYSKCKLFNAVPDIITWYDIPVKNATIDGMPVDGLYDLEQFKKRDKYAAFLHGNNGVTVIESDCNLDRQEGETSRVLIFKDSFGNCFAPFLSYSFDEVTVVDLRYFMETEKLIQEGDYDEILILYSFPSFAQETSIANLRM